MLESQGLLVILELVAHERNESCFDSKEEHVLPEREVVVSLCMVPLAGHLVSNLSRQVQFVTQCCHLIHVATTVLY